MAPRRIVDAHVHFWDKQVEGLSWAFLDPDFQHPRLGALKTLDAPQYCVDEFVADTGTRTPQRIVHVQAARATAHPETETRWLSHLAETRGWPDAIVGYCDLSRPDAAEVVARHAAFSRLRGVRDLPAGMRLTDPDVARGYGLVAATGTTIEVMTSFEHYDALADLARRWPQAPVVLGHAGLPTERDDAYYASWSAALARLATAVPTMTCKISAIASGADPHWTVGSIRRWVLGCIEAFGPARCMLASNWPVDKLFGTYERLWDAYEEILSGAGLGAADLDAVFAGTAERVYRLDPE